MPKLDDAVGDALSTLSTCGVEDPDVDLLRNIVAQMGPSAYGGDGEYVACSDDSELARVRTNYLVKKLGLEDADATMDSIQAVCATMKPAGSHKRRSAFYYLLATHHGKEGVYDG
ncbi:DUF2853 family protein [Rubrivirga sp.]|uniref:DUF2853 family protein n=1 Tax=Rubrivirga sp. TaxID=1885344 RepID=UPI003C74B097